MLFVKSFIVFHKKIHWFNCIHIDFNIDLSKTCVKYINKIRFQNLSESQQQLLYVLYYTIVIL